MECERNLWVAGDCTCFSFMKPLAITWSVIASVVTLFCKLYRINI